MPGVEVPYHAQTAEFSCGAACLAMALAARNGSKPDRGLEFEVWREANMIGVRGIDQWGLSIPALERGLEATVVSPSGYTFPRQDPADQARRLRERLQEAGREAPSFTEQDLELSWYAQQDNRERAQRAGVEWLRREPTLEDVTSVLEQGGFPILLVDLETLSGTWPAPHWVLVDRVEGDEVRLLDPDKGSDGRRTRSWAQTREAMDVSRYDAQPCLVALGARPS